MHDHPVDPAIRLTDGAFYAADPHAHFRWMREHAPVYWDDAGQVWGITRWADVVALSRDTETWRSSGGIRPDSPAMQYMIDMDDPDHRKRRALVNKGFTPRRVQEREARVREIAVDLLERAKARGRFDFVHDVAAWLPLVVIGDMLGVDPADHARLLAWSEAMILGTGATTRAHGGRGPGVRGVRRVPAPRHRRPARAPARRPREHPGPCRGRRRAARRRRARDGGAPHPDRRRRDDPPRAERRHVPAPPPPRAARCARGGPRAHPDGGRGDAPLGEPDPEHGAHGRPRRGARRPAHPGGREGAPPLPLRQPRRRRVRGPFRFDVARAPNEHVAFGIARALLPGANLARIELRVLVEEAVQRLPDLALATDDPPPLRASNFISGLESLPVACRP
jgi:cytochrome P450 family 142 subfamily A polypeptide 1